MTCADDLHALSSTQISLSSSRLSPQSLRRLGLHFLQTPGFSNRQRPCRSACVMGVLSIVFVNRRLNDTINAGDVRDEDVRLSVSVGRFR